MNPWLQQYREVGFLHIKNFLSQRELISLTSAFEEIYRLSQKYSKTTDVGHCCFKFEKTSSSQSLKFVKWASTINEELNKIRLHPGLFDICSELFGKNIKQVVNQMHWKMPGDGISFQYHQDCTFRKPDAAYQDLFHSFIQTGILVDSSTRENGALEVFPGSHLHKKPLLEGGYSGWQSNQQNQKVIQNLGKVNLLTAKAGDLLAWNPYLVHGSKANTSEFPRRFYINGFAKAENCQNGIDVYVNGKPVSLKIDSATRWDRVEEA